MVLFLFPHAMHMTVYWFCFNLPDRELLSNKILLYQNQLIGNYVTIPFFLLNGITWTIQYCLTLSIAFSLSDTDIEVFFNTFQNKKKCVAEIWKYLVCIHLNIYSLWYYLIPPINYHIPLLSGIVPNQLYKKWVVANDQHTCNITCQMNQGVEQFLYDFKNADVYFHPYWLYWFWSAWEVIGAILNNRKSSSCNQQKTLQMLCSKMRNYIHKNV